LQACIIAKNKLEISFNAWELEVICRRAQLAGVTVTHVFRELVEPVLSGERLTLAQVPKKFMEGVMRGPATTTRNDLETHRTKLKLDDGVAQRIVFLRETEDLSVAVIAQRCNVAATTIRRILDLYQSREHVHVPTAPSCRVALSGFKSGPLSVSFPKIERRNNRNGNGNGQAQS
jgi:hypothetical protein